MTFTCEQCAKDVENPVILYRADNKEIYIFCEECWSKLIGRNVK